MTDPNRMTAVTVLHAFLELQSLSPDLNFWTEERLKGNPPRLIRMRRLIAMFQAFEIPWNPRAFVEGKFIDPDEPRYAPLLSRLAATLRESDEVLFASATPDVFGMLYNQRVKIESVLAYSTCVYEAGGLYLHAYKLAHNLNKTIEANVTLIDSFLADFISPERAEYSVEQLTRDFKYPLVNLAALDEDWF